MLDRKQLQKALISAFPDIPSFNTLLQGINRNWWLYAGPGTPLGPGVMEVIVKAEAENWLPLLLHAVETSEAKENPDFRAFLADHSDLAAGLRAPARERYLKRLMGEIAAKPGYSELELVAELHAEPDPLLAPWAGDPNLAVLYLESRREERTREEFTDAQQAFAKVKRAALLGAPGAGKSTTLRRQAVILAEKALNDFHEPVPLFLPLGAWRDERPLAQFIAGQAPEIELNADARLALLLDGLNEMPTERDLRRDKVRQLREWIAGQRPETRVIVTCRLDDYKDGLDELGLEDTLTLQDLKPWRVREVLRRWAGSIEEADALFWKLAGDPGLAAVLKVWTDAGGTEESFWTASDPNWLSFGLGLADLWRKHVPDTRSLVKLAANPFLLTMLFHVWRRHRGELPRNRSGLMREFVTCLLARERLIAPGGGKPQPTARGEKLLTGLTSLAWHMQTAQLTVTPWEAAMAALGGDESLVKLALDTNLLDGGSELRFVHQLLQEYFAALALRERLGKKLKAAEFWPAERWWERSGWEETVVLLAGLFPEDCSAVARWVAEAQPEVAAQCALDSGATLPKAVLEGWQRAWLPLLTDVKREPRPEARAALGRALGRLGLDDRKGVGVRDDVPEIDWVRIPGGAFAYQEDKRQTVETFYMARFPVTNAQYDAFLHAPDGYADDRWWAGLTDPDRRGERPRWSEPNHPRERVSWYEAMAFCAWLSHRLGFAVRLPAEEEWERAARGTDGREYPWGNGYKAGFANINETYKKAGPHYLEQTSAVGIYPQGASAEGAMDLAGNVWEWCVNEHAKPKRTQRSGTEPRVLRGGSWFNHQDYARAAYRLAYHPDLRGGHFGFRVVCSSPIC